MISKGEKPMSKRNGRAWDLSLLQEKIQEQNATIMSKALPSLKWRYVFFVNDKPHEISQSQFDGDSPGWPKAGKYVAEGYGVDDENPLFTWEGTHYDERSNREDRGNPTEIDAYRRCVADITDQLRHDAKEAYRQRDQSLLREKKAREEAQATSDALTNAQRDNLYLRRERDAAVIAQEEAEMRTEAAIDELNALMAKGGELSKPAERLGYGLVQSLLENVFDMKPQDIASEVRAATEDITMAVVHCPEAQEALYRAGLLPRPQDDPNTPVLLILRAAGYDIEFEGDESAPSNDEPTDDAPTGDESPTSSDESTEEGETPNETTEEPQNEGQE
jgi:hypothetical protein